MEKPVLSPNFTIEDIHKLREYHYYLTKDMTPQQRIDFYNEGAAEFEREMALFRLRSKATGQSDRRNH